MRWRQQHLWLLGLSLLSFILLGVVAYVFSPETTLGGALFFLALLAATSMLGMFVTAHIRWGALIGIFVTSFFLLRFLDLSNPFYMLLVMAVIVLIEFALRQR